jgi:hypothetical protein
LNVNAKARFELADPTVRWSREEQGEEEKRPPVAAAGGEVTSHSPPDPEERERKALQTVRPLSRA